MNKLGKKIASIVALVSISSQIFLPGVALALDQVLTAPSPAYTENVLQPETQHLMNSMMLGYNKDSGQKTYAKQYLILNEDRVGGFLFNIGRTSEIGARTPEKLKLELHTEDSNGNTNLLAEKIVNGVSSLEPEEVKWIFPNGQAINKGEKVFLKISVDDPVTDDIYFPYYLYGTDEIESKPLYFGSLVYSDGVNQENITNSLLNLTVLRKDNTELEIVAEPKYKYTQLNADNLYLNNASNIKMIHSGTGAITFDNISNKCSNIDSDNKFRPMTGAEFEDMLKYSKYLKDIFDSNTDFNATGSTFVSSDWAYHFYGMSMDDIAAKRIYTNKDKNIIGNAFSFCVFDDNQNIIGDSKQIKQSVDDKVALTGLELDTEKLLTKDDSNAKLVKVDSKTSIINVNTNEVFDELNTGIKVGPGYSIKAIGDVLIDANGISNADGYKNSEEKYVSSLYYKVGENGSWNYSGMYKEIGNENGELFLAIGDNDSDLSNNDGQLKVIIQAPIVTNRIKDNVLYSKIYKNLKSYDIHIGETSDDGSTYNEVYSKSNVKIERQYTTGLKHLYEENYSELNLPGNAKNIAFDGTNYLTIYRNNLYTIGSGLNGSIKGEVKTKPLTLDFGTNPKSLVYLNGYLYVGYAPNGLSEYISVINVKTGELKQQKLKEGGLLEFRLGDVEGKKLEKNNYIIATDGRYIYNFASLMGTDTLNNDPTKDKGIHVRVFDPLNDFNIVKESKVYGEYGLKNEVITKIAYYMEGGFVDRNYIYTIQRDNSSNKAIITVIDKNSFEYVNKFTIDQDFSNCSNPSAGNSVYACPVTGMYDYLNDRIILRDGTSGKLHFYEKEANNILAHNLGDIGKNLIAYYSFNEDNVARNMVTGIEGTIYNAESDEGKVGKSILFKESDGYIDTNDNIDIAHTYSEDDKGFTISTWIKATEFPSDSNGLSQIVRSGAYPLNYLLRLKGEGLSFGVWTTEGWSEIIHPLTPEQKSDILGKWAHIAAKYDGTKYILYINGNQVASQVRTGDVKKGSDDTLFISSSVPEYRFKGNIDELAIWARSLDDEEIKNIYETKKPIQYFNLDQIKQEQKYKVFYDYSVSNIDEVESYNIKSSGEKIDNDKKIKEGVTLSNKYIQAEIAKKVSSLDGGTIYPHFNGGLFRLVRKEGNSNSQRKDITGINNSSLKINNQIHSFNYDKDVVFRNTEGIITVSGQRDKNMVVPIISYELGEDDEFITGKLTLRNEGNIDQTYSKMELLYNLSGNYTYIDNFNRTKNNISSNATKYVEVDDVNSDDALFFAIDENSNQRISVPSGSVNNVTFLFKDIKVSAQSSKTYKFYIGSKKDIDDNIAFYKKISLSDGLLSEFDTNYESIKKALENTRNVITSTVNKTENIIASPNSGSGDYSYPSNNVVSGEYMDVRYIRNSMNGSTSNCGNHWVEIQAYEYKTGKNVALRKTVRNKSGGQLRNASRITDGSYSNRRYYADAGCGRQIIEVDLGGVKKISNVRIWHYFDGREYKDNLVEVSRDGRNWVKLHAEDIAGRYKETSKGRGFSMTPIVEHNDKKGTHFLFPGFNRATNTSLNSFTNGNVHILPFEDDTVASIQKINEKTGVEVGEPELIYLEEFGKKYTFGVEEGYLYDVTTNKNVTLVLDSYYGDINKNNSQGDEDGGSYDSQMGKEILLYLPGNAYKKGSLFISHPYDKTVNVNITDKTMNKLNYSYALTKSQPYQSLKNVGEGNVLYITADEAITVYYGLGTNPGFNQMVSPISNKMVVPAPGGSGKKMSVSTETSGIEDNLVWKNVGGGTVHNGALSEGTTLVKGISQEWYKIDAYSAIKAYAGNYSKAAFYRNNLYSDNKRSGIGNEYEVANVGTNKLTLISDEDNDNINIEIWKRKKQLPDEAYREAVRDCGNSAYIINDGKVYSDKHGLYKPLSRIGDNGAIKYGRYTYGTGTEPYNYKSLAPYGFGNYPYLYAHFEHSFFRYGEFMFQQIPSQLFEGKKIVKARCPYYFISSDGTLFITQSKSSPPSAGYNINNFKRIKKLNIDNKKIHDVAGKGDLIVTQDGYIYLKESDGSYVLNSDLPRVRNFDKQVELIYYGFGDGKLTFILIDNAVYLKGGYPGGRRNRGTTRVYYDPCQLGYSSSSQSQYYLNFVKIPYITGDISNIRIESNSQNECLRWDTNKGLPDIDRENFSGYTYPIQNNPRTKKISKSNLIPESPNDNMFEEMSFNYRLDKSGEIQSLNRNNERYLVISKPTIYKIIKNNSTRDTDIYIRIDKKSDYGAAFQTNDNLLLLPGEYDIEVGNVDTYENNNDFGIFEYGNLKELGIEEEITKPIFKANKIKVIGSTTPIKNIIGNNLKDIIDDSTISVNSIGNRNYETIYSFSELKDIYMLESRFDQGYFPIGTVLYYSNDNGSTWTKYENTIDARYNYSFRSYKVYNKLAEIESQLVFNKNKTTSIFGPEGGKTVNNYDSVVVLNDLFKTRRDNIRIKKVELYTNYTSKYLENKKYAIYFCNKLFYPEDLNWTLEVSGRYKRQYKITMNLTGNEQFLFKDGCPHQLSVVFLNTSSYRNYWDIVEFKKMVYTFDNNKTYINDKYKFYYSTDDAYHYASFTKYDYNVPIKDIIGAYYDEKTIINPDTLEIEGGMNSEKYSNIMRFPTPGYDKVGEFTINPKKRYDFDLTEDSTYIIKEKNGNHNFSAYHGRNEELYKDTFTTVLKSRNDKKLGDITIKKGFANQKVKYNLIGDLDYLDVSPTRVGTIGLNQANIGTNSIGGNPTNITLNPNETVVFSGVYGLSEDANGGLNGLNLSKAHLGKYTNGVNYPSKTINISGANGSLLYAPDGSDAGSFINVGGGFKNITSSPKTYDVAGEDSDHHNNGPNPLYKVYDDTAKFPETEWEDLNQYIKGENNEFFLSLDNGNISKRNMYGNYDFTIYEKGSTTLLQTSINSDSKMADVYTAPVIKKLSNNTLDSLDINKNTEFSFVKNSSDISNDLKLIEAFELNEEDASDHTEGEVSMIGVLGTSEGNITESANPERVTINGSNRGLTFPSGTNSYVAFDEGVKMGKSGTITFKGDFSKSSDNWINVISQYKPSGSWQTSRSFIFESHANHNGAISSQLHFQDAGYSSCGTDQNFLERDMEMTVTFDTNELKQRIYKNGVLVKTCNMDSSLRNKPMRYFDNSKLYIGSGLYRMENEGPTIDYVRFYNKKLSSNEVNNLYKINSGKVNATGQKDTGIICLDIEDNKGIINGLCYNNTMAEGTNIGNQYPHNAKIKNYGNESRGRNIFADYQALYGNKTIPTKIVSTSVSSILDTNITQYDELIIRKYTEPEATVEYIPNQSLHTPEKALSHELEIGKAKALPYKKVRYIRNIMNGSNENSSNHWIEIQALEYKTNTNRAFGRPTTINGSSASNIGRVTDGSLGEYFSGGSGIKTLQIDLGNQYNISEIKVWHYFNDRRNYNNNIIQVSADGVEWTDLYNSNVEGRYSETPQGRIFKLSTVEDAEELKTTSGFCAKYYDNDPAQHQLSFQDDKFLGFRKENSINNSWSGEAISGTGSDYFSVKWNGILTAPKTGTYKFRTYSDDGVRLKVNNNVILSNWSDHGTEEDNGSINLTAGKSYPIELDFYEYVGGAVIKLQWQRPGSSTWEYLDGKNVVSTCSNGFNIVNSTGNIPFVNNEFKNGLKTNETVYELKNLFLKGDVSNSLIDGINNLDSLNAILGKGANENSEPLHIESPMTFEKLDFYYPSPINSGPYAIEWNEDGELEFRKGEGSSNGYITAFFDIGDYLKGSSNFQIEYDMLFEGKSWGGVSFDSVHMDINGKRTGFRGPERFVSALTPNKWHNIKIDVKPNPSNNEGRINIAIIADGVSVVSYDYPYSYLDSLQKIGFRGLYEPTQKKAFFKNISIKNRAAELDYFDISTQYVLDSNMVNYTNGEPTPGNVITVGNTKVYNQGEKSKVEKIRYIRDWLDGNDVNDENSWLEIKAINSQGINKASGITPSSNLSITGNASSITDNDTNLGTNGSNGLQYVQIDLGTKENIDEIQVWHNTSDNRMYNYNKTEVSEDGINWFVLYDSSIDGKKLPSSNGDKYKVRDARKFEGENNIRYIRTSSNGSNRNDGNFYFEIEGIDYKGYDNITPSTITNFDNLGDTAHDLDALKNGNTNGTYAYLGDNETSMTVDFEKLVNVNDIKLWMYYVDGSSGRHFHDKKIEVSQDGTNWKTIFDSNIAGEQIETSEGYTYPTLFTTKKIRLGLNGVLNINKSPDYMNLANVSSGCEDIEGRYPNYLNPNVIQEACSFDLRLKAGWNDLEFISIVKNNNNNDYKVTGFYKDILFTKDKTYTGSTNPEVLSYHHVDDIHQDITQFTTFDTNDKTVTISGGKLEVGDVGQSKKYISAIDFDKNFTEVKTPSFLIANDFKTNYKGEIEKLVEYGNVNPNEESEGYRYILDRLGAGNTINGGNYWTEIQAYEKGTGINRALGKPVTAYNVNLSDHSPLRITDGNINWNNWTRQGEDQASYVIIDLGAKYNLEEIKVWHYGKDERFYFEPETLVGNDPNNLNSFKKLSDANIDGTYLEQAYGKSHIVNGKIHNVRTKTEYGTVKGDGNNIYVNKLYNIPLDKYDETYTGGWLGGDSKYGWKAYATNGTNVEIDTDVTRFGNPTIKANIQPNSYIEIKNESGGYHGTNQPKIKPNTVYKVSVWTKTELTGTSNHGVVATFLTDDKNGNGTGEIGSHTTNGWIQGNNDWTKLQFQFKTNENARYGHLELRVYGHHGARTLQGSVWFDPSTIQIEEISPDIMDDDDATKKPLVVEFSKNVGLNKGDVIEAFVKFDKKPDEFNIQVQEDNEKVTNMYFSDNNKELLSNKYIRYVQDYLNGSNQNTGNHWREVEVLDKNGINIALNNAHITPSSYYKAYGSGILETVIDGEKDANSPYLDFGDTRPQVKGILTMDLYNLENIYKIKPYHYFNDRRIYNDTKVKVSKDGILWQNMFNSDIEGTYAEGSNGHSVQIKTKTNGDTIRYIGNLDNVTDGNIYRLLIPVSNTGLSGKDISKIAFETRGGNIELGDMNVLRNYENNNANNFKMTFDVDILPETDKRDIIFGVTNNADDLDTSGYKVIFSNNGVSTSLYKNGNIITTVNTPEAIIKDGVNKYTLMFAKHENMLYVSSKYKYTEDGILKTKVDPIIKVEDNSPLDLTDSRIIFESNNNKYKVGKIEVSQAELATSYSYVKIKGTVEQEVVGNIKVINDLGDESEVYYSFPAGLDEHYVYIGDTHAFRSTVTDVILQMNNGAEDVINNIEYLELIKPNDIPLIITANTDLDLLGQVKVKKDQAVLQSFLNTKEYLMGVKVSLAKVKDGEQPEGLTFRLYEAESDGSIKLNTDGSKKMLVEKNIFTNGINTFPSKSTIKVTFQPIAMVDNAHYVFELATNNEDGLYVFGTNNPDIYTGGSAYTLSKEPYYKEAFEFNRMGDIVYGERGSIGTLGDPSIPNSQPTREVVPNESGNLKIIGDATNRDTVIIPDTNNNTDVMYEATFIMKGTFPASNGNNWNLIAEKGVYGNAALRNYGIYIDRYSPTSLMTYFRYANDDKFAIVADSVDYTEPNSEIAVVLNTRLNTLKIYKNGVLTDDVSDQIPESFKNVPLKLSNAELHLMKQHNGWSRNMELDYFRIYDRALSDDRILSLYQDRQSTFNKYQLPYDIMTLVITKDSDLETLEERTYDVGVGLIKEVDGDLILEGYDAGDGIKRLIIKGNSTFRVKGNIIVNADEVLIINDNTKTGEDAISYVGFITDNDIIIGPNTKILQGGYFARGSIKTELSDEQLYVYGLLSGNEVDLQNRTFIKEGETCTTENNDACSVVIEFDKRLYKRMPPLFFQSNDKDGFEIKEE